MADRGDLRYGRLVWARIVDRNGVAKAVSYTHLTLPTILRV